MVLVSCCCVPAAALGPSDPAAAYYGKCVAPSRGTGVPDEGCDRLINDALLGIIIGQFNQERPTFCYPQKFVDQMRTVDNELRESRERSFNKALRARSKFIREMQAEMRAAVEQYMRENPKRLSEKTLEVIFAALLRAFPCPG
jgi:hypothetical protein